MKNYEVTLMATSYKTVKICADSEDEAVEMARDIYTQSDVLNFTDADVDEIAVQADELEEDDPDCRDDDIEYLHLQEEFAECFGEAHFAVNDLERAMESVEAYYKKNRSLQQTREK